MPATVKKLIVSEGKRQRQKERSQRCQATKRERSASPRSSSRSSSSGAPAGAPAAAVAERSEAATDPSAMEEAEQNIIAA